MKRKQTNEKNPNLIANLHDKTEYVVHKESLKLALNDGLALRKVPRVVKFNQKAWPEPYIDMNTELKKNKKWFWERLFQAE